MNRNFEFKQLLRAYRGGIIDEATFESEVHALENGSAGSNGHRGFTSPSARPTAPRRKPCWHSSIAPARARPVAPRLSTDGSRPARPNASSWGSR